MVTISMATLNIIITMISKIIWLVLLDFDSSVYASVIPFVFSVEGSGVEGSGSTEGSRGRPDTLELVSFDEVDISCVTGKVEIGCVTGKVDIGGVTSKVDGSSGSMDTVYTS